VAQVIVHLLCKYEGPSSNPNPTTKKKKKFCQDRSLKPAWANSSQDPITKKKKKNYHKKELVEGLK
jgi:hypothetical protein